ncbi:MAG: hypothetical protein KGM17_10970 [Sphingomonadales bacterium]|nr:hypothetical protein [Sphingomonadales bacterium]
MERHGTEIHLDPKEARAATGPRSMRTVLLVSLALIIFAFGVIWAAKGWNAADVTDPAQRAAPASPVSPAAAPAGTTP